MEVDSSLTNLTVLPSLRKSCRFRQRLAGTREYGAIPLFYEVVCYRFDDSDGFPTVSWIRTHFARTSIGQTNFKKQFLRILTTGCHQEPFDEKKIIQNNAPIILGRFGCNRDRVRCHGISHFRRRSLERSSSSFTHEGQLQ